MLSSIIKGKHQDIEDDLDIDLFPDQNNYSGKQGELDMDMDGTDMIIIDNNQGESKHQKMSKNIDEMFGDFEVEPKEEEKENDEGEDLLALMDSMT